METAEEMRVRLAEMKLSALETEYYNTNWAFNMKLKSLREVLALKSKQQANLQAQLDTLKASFADHQSQLALVMMQLKLDSQSTTTASKVLRPSPKKAGKGLFFNVVKEGNREINLSPSNTKISATSSPSSSKRILDHTRINPQKRHEKGTVRGKGALHRMGEKTVQSVRSLQQVREARVWPALRGARGSAEGAFAANRPKDKRENILIVFES